MCSPDRLEQRAVPLRALGNEVAPVAGAGIRAAFGFDEGRAAARPGARRAGAPIRRRRERGSRAGPGDRACPRPTRRADLRARRRNPRWSRSGRRALPPRGGRGAPGPPGRNRRASPALRGTSAASARCRDSAGRQRPLRRADRRRTRRRTAGDRRRGSARSTAALSSTSLTGARCNAPAASARRCDSGSNQCMVSITSPKKSSRTGRSTLGGKISTMPPRTA